MSYFIAINLIEDMNLSLITSYIKDKFNLFTLSLFGIGIVVGILVFLLLLLTVYLLSRRKKKNNNKVDKTINYSVDDLQWLIHEKQAEFKNKDNQLYVSPFILLKRTLLEMSDEIVHRLNPKCKHPYFDFSVSEILALSSAIIKAINTFVDRIPLLEFTVNETKINSLVKFISSFKNNKKTESAFKQWIKSSVNKTLYVCLEKLWMNIIQIVGFEVYSAYSKKMFQANVEVDEFIVKLVEKEGLKMLQEVEDVELEF